MLSEAYGGEAVKKSKCFVWHKQFKEGHESMKVDERSGLPKRTDESVEEVQIWCIQMFKYQSYGCATKFEQSSSYMCRKRPELWPNSWILHHDTAPAHMAPFVSSFWPKNRLLKVYWQ
jgi:hypothetical protein